MTPPDYREDMKEIKAQNGRILVALSGVRGAVDTLTARVDAHLRAHLAEPAGDTDPPPTTPTTRKLANLEIERAGLSVRREAASLTEEQVRASLHADMRRTTWTWAKRVGAVLVAVLCYLLGRLVHG